MVVQVGTVDECGIDDVIFMATGEDVQVILCSMSAVIFDGRGYSEALGWKLASEVERMGIKGVFPRLAWISLGDVGANQLYGRVKEAVAIKLGIGFEKFVFAGRGAVEECVKCIERLNLDEGISGIMVQLPMEMEGRRLHLDEVHRVLSRIVPGKDVDCLCPENLGRVLMGVPLFLPATVLAIWKVLGVAYGTNYEQIRGQRVAVVGGGLEVGKPLVNLLSNKGASVVWLRASERNLSEMVCDADVIITATGSENLIKREMVKSGAVVIDVGSPMAEVNLEVREEARFLTPVPGGVGPVTVMCLMENVVEAAKRVGELPS